MHIDYSIYLVTDRGILKGRNLVKATEAAIKGGASVVQLREKDCSTLEFFNVALEVKEVTTRYNVPLIINDRLDIALAVEADGLHIGQGDLPLKLARKLLGNGKILGYSVSNTEEARFGEDNGADYLGAGPIFPTDSKLDAVAPIGIEGLEAIVRSVKIPVVGIGGISINNAKKVHQAGAAGASVISAILGAEEIEAAAKNLLNHWKG